jgi:hypothetical protein
MTENTPICLPKILKLPLLTYKGVLDPFTVNRILNKTVNKDAVCCCERTALLTICQIEVETLIDVN